MFLPFNFILVTSSYKLGQSKSSCGSITDVLGVMSCVTREKLGRHMMMPGEKYDRDE